MKVKLDKLSEKEIIHTLDALYTAAGAIQGRAQMKLFLRDLLTPSERIMLGRRIIIARKLLDGETYEDISSGMKVGQDTVWKVQKWLDDQMPGYEKAISGMKKEFNKRAEKKFYAKSMLYRLKKKYPLHFLLVPTPKLKNNNTLIYQSKGKVIK